MRRDYQKVVIVGANGAMGAGSGAVFASAGLDVTFIARTRERAEAGRGRAIAAVKSNAIGERIRCGGLDALPQAVADADLVLEAVAEELAAKNAIFAVVDAHRRADTVVATVSSGLSIAAMARDRSDGFRRNFMGVHLFNPPPVMVGVELVAHAGTDREVLAAVRGFLEARCGREVIETADTAAFAGNRVGFRVLNELAQLAAEHGVVFIDELVGPHTGRAMAPLATIDFVGWDVHKAIVDNLHALTADEAHAAFALPAWMQKLIASGYLGAKTPEHGGFYRREGKRTLVLHPLGGSYRPLEEQKVELPPVVGQMRALNRVGRYRDAFDALATAEGAGAELLRRVVLAYVSYGLGRVGEVVREVRDVDRIMAFGWNWAPPGLVADLVGPRRVLALLEKAKLPVPAALVDAVERRRPLFAEPNIDRGRFFVGGAA
jgi:3-hydroxyacyl-CoA dehydrogenase